MKKTFAVLILVLGACLSLHAQTSYSVVPNIQGLTAPPSVLNDTLDLNYETAIGITADVVIKDSFSGSGSISFANTPANEEGTAYLLGGTVTSQQVSYNSQGYPSALLASFSVSDSAGGTHTVTLNWTFTYSTIRINRYSTRLARSVAGTIEVD